MSKDRTAIALENAINNEPADVSAWSAYADYLQENGDPRGEFMRVQLALEDEKLPKAARRELSDQEFKLLKAHQRDWLGPFATVVLEDKKLFRKSPCVTVEYHRGWLSTIRFESLSVASARALAGMTTEPFVHRLTVNACDIETSTAYPHRYADAEYEPGSDVPDGVDVYGSPSLYALMAACCLANLRVFRFGYGPESFDEEMHVGRNCHENGEPVSHLVARMPRLEELYLFAHDVPTDTLFSQPMPNLRMLTVNHLTHYPLEILAKNSSLQKLECLSCHPHALRADDPDAYIGFDQLNALCQSPHMTALNRLRLRLTDFGDRGVDVIVRSGLLGRLHTLDLSYGCITEVGATTLARCPDLAKLIELDLSQNAMSMNGVTRLRNTGVNVVAEDQHGETPELLDDENDYLDYLCNGDME